MVHRPPNENNFVPQLETWVLVSGSQAKVKLRLRPTTLSYYLPILPLIDGVLRYQLDGQRTTDKTRRLTEKRTKKNNQKPRRRIP
uniref:Putative basic tail protein n=1 Tax=Ixodes ricinus TaxID=34613 RepID=A0A0K8REH6_IXORI